ncbi:MAG: coproporphyrinogen dehydrogenase HemZ [Bacillota bacterium]|nr:MAG: coproporphyrinogen dehydrogenase HemZ [Bacillota bacterium]
MKTNTPYEADINEVVKLFLQDDADGEHVCETKGGRYENTVRVGEKRYYFSDPVKDGGALERKRYEKRNVKLSVYRALSDYYRQKMPWGALTGIRPSKLAYQELEKSGEFLTLFNEMEVSGEKRKLIEKLVETQRGVYDKNDENADFFVFIPFCPSKCRYCSFITADIARSGKFIPAYVDALLKEIEAAKPLVKKLRSVYIGGGTPVALPAAELERVLAAVDAPRGVEYTVEAGRPDCITAENVALLKKYGVTRVCVNPQTFNDRTLARIGRGHTAADIYEKYALLKDDFSVNMDLIAGLEGETAEDFSRSVDAAIALKPDNITVHTLCLKSGAALKEETARLSGEGVAAMVEYAHAALAAAGYAPYYLYRQKYMAGNLENTGYTLPDRACVYNVDTMEEISSTVACGANAVSKAVFDGCERIERYKNPKDIPTYLQKIDAVIEKKARLFAGKSEK